jgi:hypothetical protein
VVVVTVFDRTDRRIVDVFRSRGLAITIILSCPSNPKPRGAAGPATATTCECAGVSEHSVVQDPVDQLGFPTFALTAERVAAYRLQKLSS